MFHHGVAPLKMGQNFFDALGLGVGLFPRSRRGWRVICFLLCFGFNREQSLGEDGSDFFEVALDLGEFRIDRLDSKHPFF